MKNIKMAALFLGLGFLLVSCGKEKNEWENYYGYTNDDIVGTYSFSNITSSFDGVEGIGRYVCEDAEVSISVVDSQSGKLAFSLNCPDENYSRTIEDTATPNEDDFMIRMSTGFVYSGGHPKAHNITGYVMKNAKQQIRIHGFAAVNTYKVETDPITGTETYVVDNGVYYYFDVIKD